MKKRAYEKNRRILYVVLSALLIIGAIGGVAARELNSKPYDAPDLYLTLGSETYDLLEGITYDSDSYDLAVKDDGGFNINQVGKYEVSYTLTPKGEETSSEEAETQSLEGEPSQQTETSEEVAAESVDDAAVTDETDAAVQSEEAQAETVDETTVADEADAAVQSEEANADTEAETQSVAEDGTEAVEESVPEGDAGTSGAVEETVPEGDAGTSETVTEETKDAAEATSEETITVTEITPMQSKTAEEATSQDDSSTEETILFKRNVWVQSESEDAKYLVAEPLEIETGSTDWDLFDGVELRDASGEPVTENVTYDLSEDSWTSVKEYSMTNDEVVDYIETMEKKGEDPVVAHETSVMTVKNDDGEVTNPPLKSGAYVFDIEATDEETGETYRAVRSVVVRNPKTVYNLTYRAGAYANRMEEKDREQQIDELFAWIDNLAVTMWKTGYNGGDGNWHAPLPTEHLVAITQSYSEHESTGWNDKLLNK